MKLKLDPIMRGCLSFLLVLFTGVLVAQTAVSGTITDADSGDPLIGASVLVTGTSTGTVTDFDGNFSINVPANAESLTISYTGYATQEVALNGQTVLNVELSSGELLEEVVVVGYGSVKKDDLTGAVVALTTEDFNQGVINSPEELIQGRAAGVQVTQTSGEPGAALNFRIRGTASVGQDNNPLFVIDGVPLTSQNTAAGGNIPGLGNAPARNPLNFLNPNDIAGIDILKDASATAIYGSRGANGVVIITTKTGDTQGNSISYDANFGVSTVRNKYDLLGREEYLAAYTELNGADAAATLDGGADTDWQDELFRTAFTHGHSLAFGSNDDLGNYRLSFNYFDQQGIIDDSGLRRISARFNGSKDFLDERLTISTQVVVSELTDDNVPVTSNSGFTGDLLGNILKANPTQPIYQQDANGNDVIDPETGERVFNQVSATEPNPRALLELYEGYTNTLRFLGNLKAELKLTEALSFNTIVSLDRSFSQRADAQSPQLLLNGVDGIGRATIADLQTESDLWENYLNYKQDFGAVGFDAVLGYSYQRFESASQFLSGAGFRTNDLDLIINNFSSAAGGLTANTDRSIDELQSFFGRVNFNLNDKILLTATVRADGSTRFGGDNRYGVFPSFAARWRISEESFAPEVFSTLALRAGYGITGNQAIPTNLYQNRRRFSNFNFSADGTQINGGGSQQVAFANPSLQWESSVQYNAGIDFGFNNNRIAGTLDFYYKDTDDVLLRFESAQPAAQPFFFDNVDASIVNQGVELGLDIVAVDGDNFDWDLNFNIAYNDNQVKEFPTILNTGEINGQGLTGAFAQRIAEGQPLYAYFLRPFGGFDSEGNTIYPEGDAQQFTGDSPLPTVTGGLTNRFSYGDFDLSIFFTGQFGHHIYSNTENAFFTAGSLASGRNVISDVVGNGEGRSNAPDVSTRFLEKGDFVRLQNVTFGYNLPSNAGLLKGLRLFVTGQNLAVFTSYSGQDPEVSISKPINGIPSVGIDYTAYPRPTTVTFGLNATL